MAFPTWSPARSPRVFTAAIVAITSPLDVAYIEKWTAALGVDDLWRQIADKA